MAEKNVNEQKVQKKSEKDKNGVIGGVVFGIILLFLTYQIYDLLFEFPIGQIGVYILGFLTFICFAYKVYKIGAALNVEPGCPPFAFCIISSAKPFNTASDLLSTFLHPIPYYKTL